MFRIVVLLTLIIGCALTGCTTIASQRYVAFGTAGQTPPQQFTDTAECEQIAQMNKHSDAETAAVMGGMGAVVGGASGAAYGAIIGAVGHGISAGSGSLVGLGVGAAVGLTVGVIQALRANQIRYESIFLACMRARRYELGG
jgi:hypothetical protein